MLISKKRAQGGILGFFLLVWVVLKHIAQSDTLDGSGTYEDFYGSMGQGRPVGAVAAQAYQTALVPLVVGAEIHSQGKQNYIN